MAAAKKRQPDALPGVTHATVPLDALHPHPRNYRAHPEAQIGRLAASLARFGQVRSVVVQAGADGRYLIVAGHGLAEAAKREGYATLEADVIPAHWTADAIEGYLIADNESSREAEDDLTQLAAMLEEQRNAGYHLESLGYSEDDLTALLAQLADEQLAGSGRDVDDPDGGGDDFDTTPEEGPTRCQPGDLWQLGQHRLLCGDSTKQEDVERLMAGEQANMVFTDPPYGVAYRGRGKTTREQEIENDDLDPDALHDFLLTCFEQFPLADGCNLYVCHDDRRRGIRPAFENAFLEAGFTLGTTIIWVKNAASMGWQDYRRQHEPILFGWNNGNNRVRVTDRAMTTVWEIGRDGANTYQHPTQKPIALAATAIINSSAESAVLYEPFCGSGSTLIAAERLGRKCRAIELDPRYCDVILRRWEAETGREAVLMERIEQANGPQIEIHA